MKGNRVNSLIEEINAEKRDYFKFYLGAGGHYTDDQKEYAFDMISESGVRATSLILGVPRRTLQRWCRQNSVYVQRCPDWVYDWAERRKKRREFWAWRGFC